MEEKKRTVTKVQAGEKAKKAVQETAQEVKPNAKKVEALSSAEEKSKATTLRIVSAILWVVAIACEVLAILCLFKALRLPGLSQMWWMIIFIVIDLICCVAAALLWKKSNHLAPFSGQNKVKFFILSQLGAIMAAICFLPLIILVLTSKDKLDKKSKTIVTIVACVALAIACLLGIDFHPLTAEQKEAASAQLGDFERVYWTRYGHKYHLYEDCQAIKNSSDVSYSEGETLESGEKVTAVQVAIDNGCTGLCKFCADRAEKEGVNLNGVITEDGSVIKKDIEEPVENQDLPLVNDGE